MNPLKMPAAVLRNRLGQAAEAVPRQLAFWVISSQMFEKSSLTPCQAMPQSPVMRPVRILKTDPRFVSPKDRMFPMMPQKAFHASLRPDQIPFQYAANPSQNCMILSKTGLPTCSQYIWTFVHR